SHRLIPRPLPAPRPETVADRCATGCSEVLEARLVTEPVDGSRGLFQTLKPFPVDLHLLLDPLDVVVGEVREAPLLMEVVGHGLERPALSCDVILAFLDFVERE